MNKGALEIRFRAFRQFFQHTGGRNQNKHIKIKSSNHVVKQTDRKQKKQYTVFGSIQEEVRLAVIRRIGLWFLFHGGGSPARRSLIRFRLRPAGTGGENA